MLTERLARSNYLALTPLDLAAQPAAQLVRVQAGEKRLRLEPAQRVPERVPRAG
jgi:hypothetical protein